MLSKKHLEDICLLLSGDYKQCRYLEEDPHGWKWYCIKHNKDLKLKTDQTVAMFVADCKRNKVDPKTQSYALSDNCAGFPLLKHIEQGYDQD